MGSKRNRSRVKKRKFYGGKQSSQDGGAHDHDDANPEVLNESTSQVKLNCNPDDYPAVSDGQLCQEGFILFDVKILCKYIGENCPCSECLIKSLSLYSERWRSCEKVHRKTLRSFKETKKSYAGHQERFSG